MMKRPRSEVEEEEEEAEMYLRRERSKLYYGREWERGRLLGQGGYGKVHLAHFPEHNLRFSTFFGIPPLTAVKSCSFTRSTELANEKNLLKRFRDCPFIVTCFGHDVTYDPYNEHAFVLNLFLEFADRGTLLDLVSDSPSGLPEQQVRGFTKSILGAIQRVHDEGFVHCDVKLDNVLLFNQQQEEDHSLVAKLADFGLSRLETESQPGVAGGTQFYWAPEIKSLEAQGKPADIWALGCVVSSMLTGNLPWDFKFSIHDTDSSDCARDFVNKCFEDDPKERPTAAMLLSHPFVTGAEYYRPHSIPMPGLSGQDRYDDFDFSSSDEEDDDCDDHTELFGLRKKLCQERPPNLPIFGC